MKNINKGLIANLLIILILSQAFHINVYNSAAASNYKVGMNPGMILRLE